MSAKNKKMQQVVRTIQDSTAKIKESNEKLKSLPYNKMAPNIVTLFALCSGFSSIRFTFAENWEKAVFFIFIAAILDGLDGRVARMLNGSTKFGAELDSLSDFLSFGVAPAILLFEWTMSDVHIRGLGWFLSVLFCMASSLRLARFNTMLDGDKKEKIWDYFFTGIPAPAAALCVLLPVMLSFVFPEYDSIKHPLFSGIMLFLISVLMVSKVPTLSLKKLKIPSYLVFPVMILVVLFASFIITKPWVTLCALDIIYLATIPLTIRSFYRLKNKK